MTRVVKLILTSTSRGNGEDEDHPRRLVLELWTLDGDKVAEYDNSGLETDEGLKPSSWWTGRVGDD